MAELPVKLELSQISRPDIYLLFAPLLPGGMILGAVVLRNWGIASKFIYTKFFGYYSKITILALAAYVLGLLLLFVTEYISKSFSFLLDRWLPQAKQNPSFKPWNSLEWRRLARLFIGPKLTPETDLPLDHVRYQQLAATIEQISDPEQKRSKAEELVAARDALLGADLQWMNWYFILRNYINNEEAVKQDLFRHSLIYLFNTCGLAGLIVLILIPDARNWFLWSIFGVAELLGLLFPISVDRTSRIVPALDNVMSAQMLAIIRRDRDNSNQIQPKT